MARYDRTIPGETLRLTPRLGVLLSLGGTFLFSLELSPGKPLVPGVTVVMLAFQLLPFVFLAAVLPTIRLRLGGITSLTLFSMLAFFFWAVFTSFWSELADLSLRRALLVFVPVLLLLLLVYCDQAPLRTFWVFARGMAAAGLLLSLSGLFLYCCGKTIYLNQWEGIQMFQLGPLKLVQVFHTLSSFIRISSLTGNPNTLAAYLMVSLVLTLALFAARHISMAGFLFLSGVQGLALLLTFSRAGVGCTVIAAAIYFLFTARGGHAKIIRITLTALIVLVLLFFLFGFLSQELEGAFLQRTTALSLREYSWSLVWRAFLERPFTGVGYGVSFERILEPAGIVRRTHNAHLGVLSETGLGGYMLFMGVWLLGVGQGFLRARRFSGHDTAGAAFAASFALLTVLLLHQFFENLIPRYGFHTVYWIYLLALATHPNILGEDGS